MKPKRGNCGSCHWFEVATIQQNGERQGTCCVNPPLAVQVMQMVPGSQLHPQGPQMQPATAGLRPPTTESARCEKWRPAGMLPEEALRAPLAFRTWEGTDDAAE